ncbi:MAG: hypothetical protein U0790_14695 [Isosphaeraceae bacterium]
MVQLLVAGCGSRGPVTSVPSVPTPKDLGKLAVIRLGGGADEPSEKDLLDGLKQEGLVQGTSFTIETKDAGGDASRLAGLLDDAVKGGAAVLVTLSPEAAGSPPGTPARCRSPPTRGPSPGSRWGWGPPARTARGPPALTARCGGATWCRSPPPACRRISAGWGS